MTTPQSPHPALTVWNIRHPGTGETLTCESFDEAMSKWFEGFNVPVLVTDAVPESFESANARVKAYYARTNDSQPAPTEGKEGDEPCHAQTVDNSTSSENAPALSDAATHGAASLGAAGGELLPCPFCGGEAEYMNWTSSERERYEPEIHHVRCKGNCRGYASYSYGSREKALCAWNTRTPDPAPAAAHDAGGEWQHGFTIGQQVTHSKGYFQIGTVNGFTNDRVRVKHHDNDGLLYWPQNLAPYYATPPPVTEALPVAPMGGFFTPSPGAPVAREIECTCGQDSAGEFSMLCPVHNPRHRPVPVAREEALEAATQISSWARNHMGNWDGLKAFAREVIARRLNAAEAERAALEEILLKDRATSTELDAARADRDAWKQGKYEAEKDWSNLLDEAHAEVARLTRERDDRPPQAEYEQLCDSNSVYEKEVAQLRAEAARLTADRDAWRKERDQWQQEASRLTGDNSHAAGKIVKMAIERDSLRINLGVWGERALNAEAALATATARTEALDKAMMEAISLINFWYGMPHPHPSKLDEAIDVLNKALLAIRPATRATGEHGPDTEGQA